MHPPSRHSLQKERPTATNPVLSIDVMWTDARRRDARRVGVAAARSCSCVALAPRGSFSERGGAVSSGVRNDRCLLAVLVVQCSYQVSPSSGTRAYARASAADSQW